MAAADRIEALAQERQRHWSRMSEMLGDIRLLGARGDSRLAKANKDYSLLADRVQLITVELNGHSHDLFGRKPKAGEHGVFGDRRKARRAKA